MSINNLVHAVEQAAQRKREILAEREGKYPDLASTEYIDWRRRWSRAEADVASARAELTKAIKTFCPVAVINPHWHP